MKKTIYKIIILFSFIFSVQSSYSCIVSEGVSHTFTLVGYGSINSIEYVRIVRDDGNVINATYLANGNSAIGPWWTTPTQATYTIDKNWPTGPWQVTVHVDITEPGTYQFQLTCNVTQTNGVTANKTIYSDIFNISCPVNSNQNDRTLYGDVNGDGKDELILVNVGYVGGAIRVIDLSNGSNILWKTHDNSFIGFFDASDKMFMADANGDGKKELVLVNTNYGACAIRVINMTTGDNYAWINHGSFGGLMDSSDKMFIGDINGDNKDELILVNTSYSGEAIRAVNLTTGGTTASVNHSIGFTGWMDASDNMFLGDVNGDNKDDLVLVNTDCNYGAIRAVNIANGGNIMWIDHSSGFNGFNGWMDASDRMFLSDVNGDNKDDLVLVNTSYNSGAIRTIDLLSGNNINYYNHSIGFSGWMDSNDEMFVKDINNDNKPELILVNTSYGGGAVRAFNFATGGNTKWINHGSFSGWMDSNDRMLMLDANGDSKSDLCFINTSYSYGVIKIINIMTNSDIFNRDYNGFGMDGWLDGVCPYTTNSVSLKNATIQSTAINKDHKITDKIILFPNPNNGSFNIKNIEPNSTIDIFNSNGILIKRFSNIHDNEIFINLNEAKTGLYITQIRNSSNSITKKFVIK